MAKPVWLDLFDPFYRESAVEQLREDMKAPQVSDWHIWARSSLLPDIASYIEDHGGFTSNRTNIEAANALRQFTLALAGRIARRHALDTDSTNLEQLWLAFVAHGAAYRIYYDLPTDQADKSYGGTMSGKARREKRDIDINTAAVAFNRLRKKNSAKAYKLADLEHPSGLALQRLRKLTLRKIKARANDLAAD